MSEWISVKEKLPDTGELGTSSEVLLAVSYTEGSKIETVQLVGFYTFFEESMPYEEDGILKIDGDWDWAISEGIGRGGRRIDKEFAVTHWRPLPENPEGITEELVYELDGYTDEDMEEFEFDDPGELSIYLSCPSKGKIDGDENGIAVNEIISRLPLEVGKAFRAVVNMMVEQPDSRKRCEKYADALDAFDKGMRQSDISELGTAESIFESDWREGYNNYVILENCPKNVISQLYDISLKWEYENCDGGSCRIFGGNCHIELEDGSWIDALNVCSFISIPDKDTLVVTIMNDEES